MARQLVNLSRYGIEPATLIGMSAVLMWSATVALYRGVSEAFGPVGGAALIFTAASIFAWLGISRQRRPSDKQPMPLRYLLIGGALFAGYEIALALAVGFTSSRTQAIEVGMINYLWPSLMIALAIALRQETADWRMIPGLMLSIFGVIWVSSGDQGISLTRLIENVGTNPVAYTLGLTAAILWPIYTMTTRLWSKGYNGVPLFLTVTAIVLWGHYLTSDQPTISFNMTGIWMVLSFGLLTTMAYAAWNHGVLHGNLAIMGATSYFAPVLSVLATSIIFSMTPAPSFWIGALFVTAGSLVCWASTAPKR